MIKMSKSVPSSLALFNRKKQTKLQVANPWTNLLVGWHKHEKENKLKKKRRKTRLGVGSIGRTR